MLLSVLLDHFGLTRLSLAILPFLTLSSDWAASRCHLTLEAASKSSLPSTAQIREPIGTATKLSGWWHEIEVDQRLVRLLELLFICFLSLLLRLCHLFSRLLLRWTLPVILITSDKHEVILGCGRGR